MEVNAAYKPTELGKLPEDWSVLPISELRPFITSGSRGWAPFYSDNGSPFIRISNLSRENIYPNLNDLRFVSLPENDSEGARTQLCAGDVLISITADIGIIGYVTQEMPGPSYINQHIALIRFDASPISSLFVSYYLASKMPQKLFRSLTDAGAKAGMNLTTVASVRIALPPTRAEQEAIAEALSDADALVQSLEQLLAKKRQIKQGAMQELLTGKRRLERFQVGSGYSQTEIGLIPKDWILRKLGDGIQLTSGHHVLAQYCNTEGIGVPYVTGPSDFVHGVIRHTKYTTRPTSVCSRNDILVTVKGSGAGTLVRSNGSYCISRQLMAVRVKSWSVDYIYFQLLRNGSLFSSAATGLIPGIDRGEILNTLVACPPTSAEQEEIAGILSDMDSEITSLESKLAKARQIKQGMMQELLTGRIRLI